MNVMFFLFFFFFEIPFQIDSSQRNAVAVTEEKKTKKNNKHALGSMLKQIVEVQIGFLVSKRW